MYCAQMIHVVYLINKIKAPISNVWQFLLDIFLRFYHWRVIKFDNAYYICREETNKEEVYLGGEIQELYSAGCDFVSGLL